MLTKVTHCPKHEKNPLPPFPLPSHRIRAFRSREPEENRRPFGKPLRNTNFVRNGR